MKNIKDKEKCRHGNIAGKCEICDNEMSIGNIM